MTYLAFVVSVITIPADNDSLMIGQMVSLYMAYIKMLLFYLYK